MKHKNTLITLVLLTVFFSVIAAVTGIFSDEGTGTFLHKTVRGEVVSIYGKGLYRHMTADVAIQGIAQDYITLFAGVPLLLISLFFSLQNNLRGKLLLTGVLGYFLVTYLFYLTMGMYNYLFLVYAALLGLTFFAFVLSLQNLNMNSIREAFASANIIRHGGLFLIINSVLIALLWLSAVVPPLLDGTIYPAGLDHYTTLIVQGFDLGLLLPIGLVVGILAFRKRTTGYLYAPVYMIFLSLLMMALVSKLGFMANAGVNVIPAIFIIPVICAIAILFSIFFLRKLPGKTTN